MIDVCNYLLWLVTCQFVRYKWVQFVIFLASLNNKILQKVLLIVKIIIEIKKEKKLWNNYQMCGTRQKPTRAVN